MATDLLGSISFSPKVFEDLDSVFATFQETQFTNQNEHNKQNLVNRVLLDFIRNEKTPTFCFAQAINFIQRIREENILKYYAFSNFELWLNQFSSVTEEENFAIRAKIMGKRVPRDVFQVFFPIGMNKTYMGTHFVTAHSSPDLDTTVASFWGWVDAFTARVGDGMHIWNVPGGPPPSQPEIDYLFYDVFGESVFDSAAKTRTGLTLSSYDFLTQKGMIKKHPHDLSLSLDHERNVNAIVVTDEEGYYIGDWRHFDVEGVRQVIMALNNSMRWLENEIHMRLITLFSNEKLDLADVPHLFQAILHKTIGEYDPIKEFTLRQQRYLADFLIKILQVPSGLDATFEDFSGALESQDITDFGPFKWSLASLAKSHLFDETGRLIEDRPKIFAFLQKIFSEMSNAFQDVRTYVEQLQIALQIKSEVFGFLPQYLSYRADIEEIRTKMDGYPYLTVNYPESEGKLIPVGVIHLTDLQKPSLGTVSLRDFCNREETKIPPYLEVISIIDHHKSTISTTSAPVALISDAQSSNALVAELTFGINDRYSLGGMTPEEIEKQIKELREDLSTPSQIRCYKRLLNRQLVAKTQKDTHISPERELLEYLQFLFAILEDTDLLTKVSNRDLEVVCELLNRLKSLILKKEVEIIHFDDIPQNAGFTKIAAKKLLQNPDLYSLYSKTHMSKESSIDENMRLAAQKKSFNLFSDTKVQSKMARIGQIKLFANNIPALKKNLSALQSVWAEHSTQFNANKPEVDLHLQMLSTVASAEDLFEGHELTYSHKDQLWLWIPMTELSIEHLRLFLNNFKNAPHIVNNEIEVDFLGDNAAELKQIFKESFSRSALRIADKTDGPPIAVMHYNAGSLNSRKAAISPYLTIR